MQGRPAEAASVETPAAGAARPGPPWPTVTAPAPAGGGPLAGCPAARRAGSPASGGGGSYRESLALTR